MFCTICSVVFLLSASVCLYDLFRDILSASVCFVRFVTWYFVVGQCMFCTICSVIFCLPEHVLYDLFRGILLSASIFSCDLLQKKGLLLASAVCA